MSNSCSALATKQELATVKADLDKLKKLLNQKLDKKEKQGIIKQASVIGSAIAISSLSPEIQKAINLANGALSKAGQALGKLAGFAAQISNILGILATVATIVQLAKLQYELWDLESKYNSLKSYAENLAGQLFGTQKELAKTTETANAAIKTANSNTQKIIQANNEIAKANGEIDILQGELAVANNQIGKANQEIVKVAGIANKNASEIVQANGEIQALASEVDTANKNASEAQKNALKAISDSIIAKGLANAAKITADIAKTIAEGVKQEFQDFINLKAELDVLHSQLDQAKTQLDNQDKTLKGHTTNIVENSDSIGKLASGLTGVGIVANNTSSKVNQLEQTIGKVQQNTATKTKVQTVVNTSQTTATTDYSKDIQNLNNKTATLQKQITQAQQNTNTQVNDQQYNDIKSELAGIAALLVGLPVLNNQMKSLTNQVGTQGKVIDFNSKKQAKTTQKIDEQSYPWMDENPDFRTPYKGLLAKLDNVEEFGDSVNNIIQAGLEVQENTNELIENSQQLKDSLDEFNTEKDSLEAAEKDVSASPDINNSDLIQDTGDSYQLYYFP